MSAASPIPIDLVVVAAVAENGVIGRDGELPWRLPSDMKHFRALTLGHPVVMGRKTYRSLGKPLPGRTNIVVTRDPLFAARGVVAAGSLSAGLEVARADALRRHAAAIMLIGGGELYAAALPLADRLEITRVHVEPAGDSVFPVIETGIWREIARRAGERGTGDDSAFTFCTFARIREAGDGGVGAGERVRA